MNKDPFSLSSYHYDLPQELIAQHPMPTRHASRLMVIERRTGNICEIPFFSLADFLDKGDTLIFNDTKVVPARLIGKRGGGGESEIFLVKHLSDRMWIVMARPGRRLKPGSKVVFSDTFSCEILETLENGNKVVRFDYEGNFDTILAKHGEIPLPHYIKRDLVDESDFHRYQTIYASQPGAFAAPTAGLHFSPELLDRLSEKEIEQIKLTLHTGLGTFKPVQVDDIRQHVMHEEECIISPEAAVRLNHSVAGKKRICVGTTICRTVETASTQEGVVIPGTYHTSIFIYPGYKFKYAQALLTNFHLPCSSLLMLVCAFAGYDLVMEAYAKAIEAKFRFYSYGDAMLII